MNQVDLQDEVDRKAIESIESVLAMIDSGQFTPGQCGALLGLLQTGFCGITSNAVDFLTILTEASSSVRSMPNWVVTLSRYYKHQNGTKQRLVVNDCRVSLKTIVGSGLSDFDRDFDTPSEAIGFSHSIHAALIKRGYKTMRSSK